MKSPVTHSGRVKEVDKIPVGEIEKLYKELLNMDVHPYFAATDYVTIWECEDTGYRFYYPDTIFGDGPFYAELQKNDFYYNTIHWEHLTALKSVKPGSDVLEVGCGLGYFTELLGKKGFQASGIELNDKAVEACVKKGLRVKSQLIEEYAAENPEKHDVVCAFQVLEHIYDIKGFVDGCIRALKPGGKLIFAVPNNNPWYLRYDRLHTLNLPPHHSGLWNKEAFKNLVNYFPLKDAVVKVEPLYNPNLLIESWMKNKGKTGMLKMYRKIHPGITNRLMQPVRLFREGKILLAVFTKK